MVKYRKNILEQAKPKTFDEFHAIVCKSMPDVTQHPQMYNLCYDLMKLTWETAKNDTRNDSS